MPFVIRQPSQSSQSSQSSLPPPPPPKLKLLPKPKPKPPRLDPIIVAAEPIEESPVAPRNSPSHEDSHDRPPRRSISPPPRSHDDTEELTADDLEALIEEEVQRRLALAQPKNGKPPSAKSGEASMLIMARNSAITLAIPMLVPAIRQLLSGSFGTSSAPPASQPSSGNPYL